MAKDKAGQAKPAADIQEIYAVLLGRGYQEQLFQDLPGKHKKQGRETLADCPLCQGAGHFSYSSSQPLWKCWKCEEGGDWLKYLEMAKRLSFQEALQLLADAAGVQVPGADPAKYQAYTKRASLLEAAQAIFTKEIGLDREAISPQAEPVIEYLWARGYSSPEWEAMGLGAYTDRAGLQEQLHQLGYSEQEIRDSGLLLRTSEGAALGESHQLTLLWRDPAGRAIGLAARSILPADELKAKGWQKYLYSKGLQLSQGLVGLATARGAAQLVLVEGPLDALYLNSLGLKAVALGGTALSDAQVKAIQANGTKELLLCLDSDEPGQAATERAIQKLRQSRVRAYVVSLPAGYKDPDELVRDQGLPAFQKCLEQATGWPAWMARRMAGRQDISTDRGLDRALDEALEFWSWLVDGLERRDFWDSLKDATGLSEEELAQKAREAEQRASQRASQQALGQTIQAVQAKAGQGDIIGAEQELEQGLQRLRTARGVEVPEPYLLDDLKGDILATSSGLCTGYSSLDGILKIPQGAISIIAGRPGHGKTTFLLNLLLHQVTAYPDRAFYLFSYEEARKFLALKLIMLMAGQLLSKDFNLEAHINYLKEKRGTNQEIEKAIQEYQQFTAKGRLIISDSMPKGEDLAATIGWLARRGEVGAVFVDYIQKIPVQRPAQQRYLDIKRVSDLLLQAAVQADIPIILGAQLGRRQGQGSKVTLDNLRESGDIEQDSSLVIGLYNESVDKAEEQEQPVLAREVDLKAYVLKQRGGVAGRSQALTFDRPILRIKDKRVSSLL